MISISLRREGHDPPVLTSNMTRQLGKLRSFTGGLSPTGRELRLPSFFFFFFTTKYTFAELYKNVRFAATILVLQLHKPEDDWQR